MITKVCFKCKRKLPLSKFNLRHNKYQPYCRECSNKNSKVHYKNHIKVYVSRSITRNKALRKWVQDYKKTKKCEECGNNDYRVLDFDHKDSKEKDSNISRLVLNGSIDKIKREIKKCRILCSNCHRIKHFPG